MKIALAPDLHCCYRTYDTVNSKGNSCRRAEWLSIGNRFLDTCVEQGVSVAVFPGDFFVTPRPSAEEVLMVSSLLRRFENAGIKSIGITGNHDISGTGRKTMNEVVSATGSSDWCHSVFGTEIINEVGFAFLPFVKAPEITAYAPGYAGMAMSEQLIGVAEKLLGEISGARKKILVGHWTIQNASLSSGAKANHMNEAETVLPLKALASQGWDACLFGHIHVPQILCKKPLIAYSGCFQRINIGEAHDRRGFFIYDTDSGETEFHKLPAIPMKVFEKEIKGKADFDSLLDEIHNANIRNKIAYVKYTVRKEDFACVDKGVLQQALLDGNPMNIAGIMPKIICAARQRDASLTESLDGKTALAKWLTNRKADQKVSDRVLSLYQKYSQAATDTDGLAQTPA